MRKLSLLPALIFVCALAGVSAQGLSPAPPLVFDDGGSGMILTFVKAGKSRDYEMVIRRMKDALATTQDAQRRRQAAGWKVFHIIEPGERPERRLTCRR